MTGRRGAVPVMRQRSQEPVNFAFGEDISGQKMQWGSSPRMGSAATGGHLLARSSASPPVPPLKGRRFWLRKDEQSSGSKYPRRRHPYFRLIRSIRDEA